MPRCNECSEVVIPRREPEDYSYRPLRTWPSGPELIRSADSGCDLCSFVRKEIEKVSTANLARIRGALPLVLRDYNGKINLDESLISLDDTSTSFGFACLIRAGSRSPYINVNTHTTTLAPPYDLVLLAYNLLEECVLGDKDEHDLCKPSQVDASVMASSLPRRLLDLSHGETILTVDTQEWIARDRATVDELSKYCTLSYRWGEQAPACMLRTRPIAERILILVSMPQTFQDAIIVTRGLGVRFLWIDALCIIQPSAHGDYTDWNMEGPRMWLVYQNAICTIAATCSEQPKDGFLHKVGIDYNPPCSIPKSVIEDVQPQPLFLFTGIDKWYASVLASNLNRRGWVAQERLLSRRILYFTEEGIFWECQEGEVADDVDPERFAYGNIGETLGPHHASLMVFENWLAFVELYSLSKFTMQTDRLIALSSIARCVSIERFGHEYYAGMWGSHLLTCLSWNSSAPCSVTTRESCLSIAPSWSWASVAGGVVYPTRAWGGHSKPLLEMIDVQTSLAEANDQYGNMNRGALKLRVQLCNISLPTDVDDDLQFDQSAFSNSISCRGWLTWDELQDPSTTTRVYTVIPLGIYNDFREAVYDALVIAPLPSPGDEDMGGLCGLYRRIGHIRWRIQDSGIIDEDVINRRSELLAWSDTLFPNATEQTIVIV